MSSEEGRPLSNAEKRARLAGGLGRASMGGASANGAHAEGADVDGVRRAAFPGDEAGQLVGGPNEDPVARRKRLIWGVGLSLIAVAIMVVLILALAAGN